MIVMMKKRDFFLKFRKRAAALLLAMNMALGSVSGMVLNVQAASVVKFNFVEIGETGDGVADLVAGAPISIVGNVPTDYQLSNDPPFRVKRNESDATPQELFNISKDGGSSKWTVEVDYQAGADSVKYKDSGGNEQSFDFPSGPQYSLDGILISRNPEKGKVSLTALENETDNNYGIGQVDIEVVNPALGITQKSGFSFKLQYEARAELDDDDKIKRYLDFGKPDFIVSDDNPGDELDQDSATGWFASS